MNIQRPSRATHSFTQFLAGSADEVFPLLCPVREAEWVPGWMPSLVLSDSGVAERDCVFVTSDDGREATWVVTEHDPARGVVDMVKLIPQYVLTRLRIEVVPVNAGAARATVTYSYTALGAEGERYVATRTPDAYVAFMQEWEQAMNDFLARNAQHDARAETSHQHQDG